MRKIAFLVGNDTCPKDPSIPPLRFAQNDAREFAEVLKDRETCGFETRLYLNRPSQDVLTDLDQISGGLAQDDTLLFYYSGHGKLRGNELCLVSNETTTTSLGATSIRTRLVLEYLQGSLARRRILILDCCHSGAAASIYRAVDSKSTLDGLADSFGSYILTASTTIELAEEREKDGHGVFTKALIDCLREGPKDRITINDLYEYAHSRLKVSARQTPLFWALQQEGTAVEIGNFVAFLQMAQNRIDLSLSQNSGRLKSTKFFAGGGLLASGSLDKTIKLWAAASGQQLRTLTGHTKTVGAVEFSPDGRTLASGSEDKTVKLLHEGELCRVESPRTTRHADAPQIEGPAGRRTLTGHTDHVTSVAFSLDGRTLASGSWDGIVQAVRLHSI
jgi:Caspase domain/WD domain, G-beta repeat